MTGELQPCDTHVFAKFKAAFVAAGDWIRVMQGGHPSRRPPENTVEGVLEEADGVRWNSYGIITSYNRP